MKLTNKSLSLGLTRNRPDPFARSIARNARKLAPAGEVVGCVDGAQRRRVNMAWGYYNSPECVLIAYIYAHDPFLQPGVVHTYPAR